MPVRNAALSALLAATVVVLAAVPAWAHAAFDVRQLPAGGNESFTLRVPIEVDAGNELVDVLVPAGWSVDRCIGADGWSCGTTAGDDGATVVMLGRTDDGAGDVEQFTLALTAPDAPGTYAFPVVQTYDDGTEAAWIGEPGGDRPAPTIQVGDDDTPVERSTALPTHGDTTAAPTAGVTASEPAAPPTPGDAPAAGVDPSADATSPTPTPDANANANANAAPTPDDAGDTGDDGVPAVVWVIVAVAAVAAGIGWGARRP